MAMDHPEKSFGEVSYRFLLLRLWQVDEDGKRTWRFSLENSATGERRGIAKLGELLVFFLEVIFDGQEDDQVRMLAIDPDLE